MEIIIGILLLLTFLGFACYSIKGMNLMMGLLIMSIIWTVLPLIGNQLVSNPDFIARNADTLGITFPAAVKSVFQDGPESWGGNAGQHLLRRLVRADSTRNRHHLHRHQEDCGAGR